MKSLVVILLVLFAAPCFAQDRYSRDYPGGYERFGSSTARWSTNPPRIYSGGTYLGELSSDRYAPDSVSNRYGVYGSRYSPTSVNNPHGIYGRYSTQPIWVYQPRW